MYKKNPSHSLETFHESSCNTCYAAALLLSFFPSIFSLLSYNPPGFFVTQASNKKNEPSSGSFCYFYYFLLRFVYEEIPTCRVETWI